MYHNRFRALLLTLLVVVSIPLAGFAAPVACEPVVCADHGGIGPVVAWFPIRSDPRVSSVESQTSLVVDADRAWMVGVLTGGIAGFDVSDPLAIRFTGLVRPSATAGGVTVAKFGNLLVTANTAVDIYEVSAGGELRLLSSSALNETATGPIGKYGSQLLVGGRSFTSRINITDPAHPNVLPPVMFGEMGHRGVVGNRIITREASRLNIYDATALPTARRLGSVEVANTRLAVSGRTAYVATATGILAYDILLGPDPVLVGRLDGYRPIDCLAATSSLLAFGDAVRGLVVCDVSNPATPRELTVSRSTRGVRDIEPLGDLLLVSTAGGVLHVIDPHIAAVEAAPTAFLPSDNAGFGQPAVVDDVLIVERTLPGGLWGRRTLASFDISDPDRPALLAEQVLPHALGIQFARDSYLFTTGLGVIDASDPLHPRVVVDALTAAPVAARDTLALTGSVNVASHLVKVWSIAEPLQPRLLGSFLLAVRADRLLLDGDILAVADDTRLLLADLADPVHPRVLATMELPFNFVRSWEMRDHVICLASDLGELAFVDISDPVQPRLRSRFQPPADNPRAALAMGNRHVYLNDGLAGVLVIDTNDLDQPRWIATIAADSTAGLSDVTGTWSSPLMLVGDRLLIARREAGLALVPRQCGDVEPTLTATIDVEPRDRCHRVPCGERAHGLVEVAVLTTPDFDAAQVDPASARFGPPAVPGRPDFMVAAGHGGRRGGRGGHRHPTHHPPRQLRDVDHDGDLDLVLRFDAVDLGFACGDTVGVLSARTLTGTPVCARGAVTTGRRCHRDDRDGAVAGVGDVPATPTLAPNPFNPQSTLTFELAARGRVAAGVYDVAGRLVARLADATFEAGTHRLEWRGLDDAGRAVPSGVYFVKLDGATGPVVLRAALLR